MLRIGSVEAPAPDDLGPEDFAGVDESPVRCLDKAAEQAMVEEINRLRKANECLGGIFEVRAFGLVPGLGSYTTPDERLDGRLAQAIVSIQAVKGVSVGEAWEVAAPPGLASPTTRSSTRRSAATTARPTAPAAWRAGCRTASRSSSGRAEADLDPDQAAALGRHRDQGAGRRRCASGPTPTVVPAAGVVGEAMVALVLARCYREKFGGDHIDDVSRRDRRLPGAHRLAPLSAR